MREPTLAKGPDTISLDEGETRAARGFLRIQATRALAEYVLAVTALHAILNAS